MGCGGRKSRKTMRLVRLAYIHVHPNNISRKWSTPGRQRDYSGVPAPGQSQTRGVGSAPITLTAALDDFRPERTASAPLTLSLILRTHGDQMPALPHKSTLESQRLLYDTENRMLVRRPDDSRGELILTEEHYNGLMEQLLSLASELERKLRTALQNFQSRKSGGGSKVVV